ncbi:ribonuclease H-like domain-containing protein [Tanacetum coccineum]
MVTRSQSGIVKPVDRLSLYTLLISHIPKSSFLALKDPHWCNAMYDEYNVLVRNGTWILMSRPSDVNLVHSMWLFKHKFHADGTLSHNKACLVANGVDFDETFSPVIKSATIHTVVSLVVSRQWPIHQLDVKNVFFNDDLFETIYMRQPPGFFDSWYPHDDCLMQRSLYGLKPSTSCLVLAVCRLLVPYTTVVDMESKLGLEGVPIQDNLSLYARFARVTFCRSQTYLAIRSEDFRFWSTLICIRHYFSGWLY